MRKFGCQSVFYEGEPDKNVLMRIESGYVCGVSDNDRSVHFRLSDNSLDRQNSRIDPHGIATANYAKNPVFLWGHDGYGSLAGPPSPENVIGRGTRWGIKDLTRAEGDATAAFDYSAEFAPKSVNPRAELAFKLVKGGFLSAVSIGVRIGSWTTEKGASKGKPDVIIYTETDMLEASLVPIPANPNAVALARNLVSDYDILDSFPAEDATRLDRWVHETRSAEPPAQPADIGNVDVVTMVAKGLLREQAKRDNVSRVTDAVERALERQ